MPTQNKSKVPIGTFLDGKFRVTKEIGRGGMAAVYEALNVDIGKRVAVKVLAAELITSRIVRERFIREARAASAVRSPYICDVYDAGMYEERPFLVMELLEGESLYDLLSRVRRLDAETTLGIATQTARGLSKTHAVNIIHRDLKPENIFLTHDEEGRMLAKILDFGLAKFYEPTGGDRQQVRLTREGALFGTPAYMSPEQAKGQGEVDQRADLWALACIVYECLTGHTVWNVDQGVAMILAQIANAPLPRPSRFRPDLPPSFDEWFLRALDRNPDRRFQTAKDFSASLALALRPGSILKRASMPSAEEAREVDELIASSPRSSPAPPLNQLPATPEPYGHPSISDVTPPAPDDSPSLTAPEGSGRAVVALVLAGVLALGGYAAWLYVVHPPPETRAAVLDKGNALPAGSAAGEQQLSPVERESYALQIGAAQERLAKGDSANAVTLFREAFNNGGTNVARALLAHAEAAFEAPDRRCTLSGLGRPRPFELSSPASRPTLAVTPIGSVGAWVDNHMDRDRRQAFSVLLDPALRRTTPARLVTPEAVSVRSPQLVATGDRVAFIYWDGAGNEPGVYVRMLDGHGRIAGPTKRISATRRHEFFPTLTRAEDGTFWAVWEEELGTGATDLMARRLGTALEPLSEAVRLTALVPRRGVTTAASKPDVAISRGHVNVVFTQERAQRQQIMLLRVALTDAALASGLGMDDIDPTAKRRGAQKDRYVGNVVPVGTPHGKSAQPRLACSSAGCFTVWDDEKGGAFAAFVDPDTGQPLWHREFARKGARPAIAATATETMVAYYDGLRLKLARVDRDGLGTPSVVARVSGYQPYPAIVAGPEPGQWYISWRDYEAGHYEAFVARAQCQTQTP